MNVTAWDDAEELLWALTTTTAGAYQYGAGSHNRSGEEEEAADPVGAAVGAFVRFRDDSRFWVQRVLLPVIETVGVFGNVVTIFILSRKGMRSSTNAYLTALAIADLVYLLGVFWLSLRHYPAFKTDPVLASIYAYSFPYSLWLTDATTNTSVWLTVTFTVERCIAVCLPIKGRVWCTESRAKRLIAVVYIICFTATLSTPFEWTVLEVTDPAINSSRVEIVPSRLGSDETYQSVYYWFTTITFVFLPLTLLIIFNSFLIHSVRESQRLREVMTHHQQQPSTAAGHQTQREPDRVASNEIKITITLIAVVAMFLVCQLPTAATLIYKIFHEPKAQSDEEALLQGLGNIFNFLVALNAAGNFLLYCALSDKYRRAFLLTLCRCCLRPVQPRSGSPSRNHPRHFVGKQKRQTQRNGDGQERWITQRQAVLSSSSLAGEGTNGERSQMGRWHHRHPSSNDRAGIFILISADKGPRNQQLPPPSSSGPSQQPPGGHQEGMSTFV